MYFYELKCTMEHGFFVNLIFEVTKIQTIVIWVWYPWGKNILNIIHHDTKLLHDFFINRLKSYKIVTINQIKIADGSPDKSFTKPGIVLLQVLAKPKRNNSLCLNGTLPINDDSFEVKSSISQKTLYQSIRGLKCEIDKSLNDCCGARIEDIDIPNIYEDWAWKI